MGAVFAVNVECAISFIAQPARYLGAFELGGVPGETAIRGLGIAFLMWNATYPLAIWRPWRYRAVLAVVVVQQAIGLLGELLVLRSLPGGHEALAGSLARFARFDGAGLVLMALAFGWLLALQRRVGAIDVHDHGGESEHEHPDENRP